MLQFETRLFKVIFLTKYKTMWAFQFCDTWNKNFLWRKQVFNLTFLHKKQHWGQTKELFQCVISS